MMYVHITNEHHNSIFTKMIRAGAYTIKEKIAIGSTVHLFYLGLALCSLQPYFMLNDSTNHLPFHYIITKMN